MHQPVVPAAPFCTACTTETTDESAGKAFSLNGCGVGFYGSASECPTCGSIKRGRWVTFIWIPIVPIGRYRMIYTRAGFFSSEYYSRHLAGPSKGLDARLVLGYVLASLGAFALVALIIRGIAGLLFGGEFPPVEYLVINVPIWIVLVIIGIRLVMGARRRARDGG